MGTSYFQFFSANLCRRNTIFRRWRRLRLDDVTNKCDDVRVDGQLCLSKNIRQRTSFSRGLKVICFIVSAFIFQ